MKAVGLFGTIAVLFTGIILGIVFYNPVSQILSPTLEIEGRQLVVDEILESNLDYFDKKYGGIVLSREKIVSNNPEVVDIDSTYLSGMRNNLIEEANDVCVKFSSFSEKFLDYRVDSSAMDDDEVIAGLLNFLGNIEKVDEITLIDEIKFNHENGLIPTSICNGEKDVFVTFHDGPTMFVGFWSKEFFAPRFSFFQSIPNLTLGVGLLVPEFGDEYSLVSFSGGDAGLSWQGYYFLDHETLSADLVEICGGGLDYSTSGFEPEQYYYECGREFVKFDE